MWEERGERERWEEQEAIMVKEWIGEGKGMEEWRKKRSEEKGGKVMGER